MRPHPGCGFKLPGRLRMYSNLMRERPRRLPLAEEHHADLILLDDAKARQVAQKRGLKMAGTLAILLQSHRRNLCDFKEAIDGLRNTNFYVDEELLQTVMRIAYPERGKQHS